jgi:RimJ/RimL family protein N-acetyltransferase
MTTDQPIINFAGQHVALGPPAREQMANYQRWFNDFQTMRTQGSPGPGPRTAEEMAPWYDGHMSGQPDVIWFSVYEQSTWRHIGFAELKDLDYRNRTAELTLMVGEPDARGKGYGTEIARLMLDYGFTALGLHNISLEYYAYNEAGRRAYEKAGFREFARRREAYMMGGRLWDVVYMECLATEFGSGTLAKLLRPDEPRESWNAEP